MRACIGQHHWFLVDLILAAGEALLGLQLAAHAHLEAAEFSCPAGWACCLSSSVFCVHACGLNPSSSRRGSGAWRGALQAEAAGLAEHLGLPQSPSPTSDPPPTPSPLSPREAQVLRLVATGLSSRQISEQLCLSPHTVAKHLTSIFTKLGVENRAEATAYAIRHGLD